MLATGMTASNTLGLNPLSADLVLSALGANGATRITCPVCEGGSTRERGTLTIWRSQDGVIAHCKRASCGAYGKFTPRGDSASLPPSPPRLRPFEGKTFSLDAGTQMSFVERFGFTPHPTAVHMDAEGWLVLPILDPRGAVRGHVRRFPHWWADARRGDQPKANTFKLKDEPMISWYGALDGGVCALVEDQISAMKLNKVTGIPSCALIGTGLNEGIVAEVQRQASYVTIALDRDATSLAFAHARKWGPGFAQLKVTCLPRDIKDMDDYTIEELFEGYSP